MCGVLAFISADGDTPCGDWAGAMRRLDRRGPDGRGVWTSACSRARLGHTRLAIQDLSAAGAQPMVLHAAGEHTAAGDIALSYNGEIYNAPALRAELIRAGRAFVSTCDTEVVLQGYAQWGVDDLLAKLRGMFAFVIWDGRLGEVVAAVDHARMKPLAYTTGGGPPWFAAASDCDALRRLVPRPPTLDGMSVARVLTIGYCPPPSTMWRGVRKLGPGQLLRWSAAEGLRVREHWRPTVETHAGPSRHEDFAALWAQVVREHTLSDVPVGLFLSGGLDSAAVAVALADAGLNTQTTAFTLAMPGGEDESHAAAAMAAHLGMRHERIAPLAREPHEILEAAANAYDEPQAATSLLTAAAIAHAARPHAKVILAGDGGDEAFGGYRWHRSENHPLALQHAAARRPDPAHAALARAAARPETDARQREAAMWALGTLSPAHAVRVRQFGVFHPAEASALLAGLDVDFGEDDLVEGMDEHAPPLSTTHWRRWSQCVDVTQFCAAHAMPKIDRAAMHVGLELRAPFLDRRILDYALALPNEQQEDRQEGSKPTLRRYLHGRTPAGHLDRAKQGFSLRGWKPDAWWSMGEWLDTTGLVRDGVIRRDWRAYVPAMHDFRETRMFALCMLAAWYDARM